MGVYYCKLVKDDGTTTTIETTKIRDDALITPVNSKTTVTVNVCDDVTIKFDTDIISGDLMWRKDGSTPFKSGTETSTTFNPVETTDAGMYELYLNGARSDRRHSFIKLIVRACPCHKWGPPNCTGDCDYCYNGGVCDDKTGFCICAPGFNGSTCEIACGGNSHGWNCENFCSRRPDLSSCKNVLFCLPDPYGCTCVTGYKGIKCDIECSPGTFGADCTQTCHCQEGACDRYTGICTESACAFPWTGYNCQQCQTGEVCEENECKEPCEYYRENGICKEYVRIINATFVPANNNQNTTASCSVKHYGTKNITTMIMVTNKHFTENITKVVEIEQDGENITTYTFSVTSNVDSTYECVIAYPCFSARRQIFADIFRLPVYNGSLTVLNISGSFITIEWTAWDSNTDYGNGPVVGYFLYHKLSNTNDWMKRLYENSLSGTVNGLCDKEYTFSVSAVRPGEGGEGPIGKDGVTVKPHCEKITNATFVPANNNQNTTASCSVKHYGTKNITTMIMVTNKHFTENITKLVEIEQDGENTTKYTFSVTSNVDSTYKCVIVHEGFSVQREILPEVFRNNGYITVLNLIPKSDFNRYYQCYTPSSFTDYSLSYGRSFAVVDGESITETPWIVPDSSRRYFAIPSVGMGVYYCKLVKDDGTTTTIVETTKIRDDALITPVNSKTTVTVNVCDDVTIKFDTDIISGDLMWRKDGSTPFKSGTETSTTFNPVETTDAGMYELYLNGARSDRRHSFIKLIVRACPCHKWGPPNCTGDCDYCYNGGVCDDKTGFCICAPGFNGSTCEIACGGNSHGWNCENFCSRRPDLSSCKNVLFCLPDPYGCTCVTGYKGIKCDIECSPGTFGADCTQTCHCQEGACDRYTGICTESACAFPWTGYNCQQCQTGEVCEENECKEPCEYYRENGICKEYVRIINATFVPANNNQNTTASCSVKHYGTKNITTMIMVTNKHFTENITKVVEIEQDGENITTYTFSVTSNVDSTYECVIAYPCFSARRQIFADIFRLPVYNGSLTVLNISGSFITIEWTAWDSNTDYGNGPVVGYFLYHKLSNTNDWMKRLYENSLSGTVNGLCDKEYTFSVSAARPGEGGEGPIGKDGVTVKPHCEKITNATFVPANNNQNTTASCSVKHYGTKNITTMIMVTNKHFTENITKLVEIEQDGENITKYTFSVTSNVDSTYKCVIVHEGFSVQREILPEVFRNNGYITVLNLIPKSDFNRYYQCYTPSSFTDYSLSYGRSFAVVDGESITETPWIVPDSSRRYFAIPSVGMGVYYCKLVKDDGTTTTIVETTKIRDDALITPVNSKTTVTVNVCDDVTIKFDTDIISGDLMWRKDGSTPFKSGTETSTTFNPVETTDAGMYELYLNGARSDRRHSFIKLIVRACPCHKWGPPNCTGDCEYCYNGGVCDDKTGFCICAPGFNGSTCEIGKKNMCFHKN
ncbi:uncharacterized protein [Antedon mediterranea]|uniref:uncharacterized protein n=1 Tax=Antedon mediterranea TaxID=105859 RepID=UPI003AF6D76B